MENEWSDAHSSLTNIDGYPCEFNVMFPRPPPVRVNKQSKLIEAN